MNLNYDIQEIEKTLAAFVKDAGVSQNVFEGQRPSNSMSLPSFVVVSVPTSVSDLAAYGSCTSRIELFVQNDKEGLKKGKVFSSMYRKMAQSFPIKHNKYLFDTHPTIIQLGNDDDGYFVQAININTLIKAV